MNCKVNRCFRSAFGAGKLVVARAQQVFLGGVAADQVAAQVQPTGRLGAADRLAQRTAGMETAAGGRIDRAGHVALQHDPLPTPRRVDRRHRAEQHPACRGAADGRTARGSAAISTISPRYITATRSEMYSHHRQVVRDEQVGQPEPLPQVDQQVDDLRLDRHVQGRDRLVEDHEARAAGPAPGRCRSAAAGRRRTRADSGCGRPGRGPPVRGLASTRASRSRRSPRPWTIRPSSMIARTVMRGLSEPKGSWKTICMSRRRRRQRAAAAGGDVRGRPASMRPAVGSSSRKSVRPAVVLPQPDSPTRPERLASADGEADAVHRLHVPDDAARRARGGRGSTSSGRWTSTSGLVVRHGGDRITAGLVPPERRDLLEGQLAGEVAAGPMSGPDLAQLRAHRSGKRSGE